MSYKEKLNFDLMPNAEKNAKKTPNLAIFDYFRPKSACQI